MQTQRKLNKIDKTQIFILNQLFEIEKKATKLNEKNSIDRNINKLKDFFENDFNEDYSLILENPINEAYTVTRTDVEANISGDSTENLIIIDVIKPIIRLKQGVNPIIQKAIVIVQDKETIQEEKKIEKIAKEIKKESFNSTNKSKRRLKKESKKRKGKN